MIEEKAIGIRGILIDAPTGEKVRCLRDGALVLDGSHIAEYGPYNELSQRPRARAIRWMHTPQTVILPGLIDIHAHLPQYPAVGREASGLLPWLERNIFPREREFTTTVAKRESPAFFHQLARNGTTCAAIYTTVHEASCNAAFEAAEKSGLRVILGKMLMDVDSHGSLSRAQDLDVALAESERLCRKWHGAGEGRIEYAFSPRFAGFCTMELMQGAASLAEEYGAYLQTHFSETPDEIERTKSRFPSATGYADVYRQAGLLTPKTLLAHCIHVKDSEIAMLAEAQCVVAHCPTANLFLNSGIMPLDRLKNAGLRMGLGSDVGAGTELNLWQVMRSAIESQKARSFYNAGVRIPTGGEMFHMATQGGAEALGKGDILGTLDVGKEADIIAVDLAGVLPYGRATNSDADMSVEDILSLLIYRGGPHAVVETFVRGRSLYRCAAPPLL
ncbi:MAG: guanine deaminase [Chthoniobacterales bacterium]